MADNKYDNKNGYNSSDFKRNSGQDFQSDDGGPLVQQGQDGVGVGVGEDGPKLNDKADEYMRDLLSEKIKLKAQKFPISTKLIDQEVTRVQTTGRVPPKDNKYLDVYREKPVKVTVKVLVPVKEHPKFNFVGKLLGPKGNTMKQLQEETMCKMSVLGRGSVRDRQKEEEMRNSLDPKYSHLMDELHVEISALAPPAEAHARIAYALAEVKKYLIPDQNDMMRQPPPMKDMMERDAWGPPGRPGPPRPPRMPAPPLGRPLHKTKVISILDRARSAMETSPYPYDDPYAHDAPPPPRGPPRAAPESDFYYERERYYEEEPYYKEPGAGPREYKAQARDVGTRRAPARHYAPHAPRATPYQRPPK